MGDDKISRMEPGWLLASASDGSGRRTQECRLKARWADIEEKSGAGDRDRTDDIKLGKLAFYH
jgi:hypothetical protein